MKLVVRLLAYPVMVLAGIGVLASFVLTATSIAAHSDLGKVGAHFLFPGIFVVWLPTILFANVLGADFKQRDIWKATLRGCPQWMRITQWVIIGIVFVTFFFPFLWGSKPEKSPGTFLPFSIYFLCGFVLHRIFDSPRGEDRCWAAVLERTPDYAVRKVL
jgi:hypothetical protein